MIIWYVKESNKENKIIKKIKLVIKRIFNIIEISEANNKTFCILPTKSFKIEKKIMKKLNKILYDNDVQNIVLSEELNKNNHLKNYLYSNNINILDGTVLNSYLEINIIEYILHKQHRKFNESEFTILVNDDNEININNIKEIAKKGKNINLVTNHINKFKTLETKLLKSYGIMIKITNNYNQALSKSKIILNMDFPEELIFKYNICKKAIIISLNNHIENLPKKFSGINIKEISACIPNKYKVQGFKDELIYESIIVPLKEYKTVKNRMAADKIKVKNLIGKSGIINNQEIAKIHLTKTK